MKLVRLSSDREDGVFENQINADLVIEPYSQIALSNASFTNQYPVLVINSSNNVITYDCSVGGGNARTVNLQEGTYVGTDSDAERLFQSVSKSLNDQLQLTDKQWGGEFQLNKDAGRIQLLYKISGFFLADDRGFKLNGISIDTTATDKYLYSNGSGAVTANDSVRLTPIIGLCRGAGIFRATLNSLVTNNTVNNGFRMVLTDTLPINLNTDTLTADEDKYSVSLVVDPTELSKFKYQFKLGDNTTRDLVAGDGSLIRPQTPGQDAGGFALATNDTVDIGVFGGNVVANLYQTNGGNNFKIPIFSVQYDGSKLFPILVMKGLPADITLYNVKFNPRQDFGGNDLKLNSPGGEHVDPILKGGLNAAPVHPGLRQSDFVINFSKAPDLANFIGFADVNNFTYTRPNYTDVATFTGSASFSLQSFESYVVEFRTQLLESYDGGSYRKKTSGVNSQLGAGGQFSIIKVIPNYNQNVDNRVCNYEANNLTFIDMNNSEKLLMRNFSARILDSSLTPIKTSNVSILTLLIKRGNE